MGSKCKITFNENPLGVFYAGQTVSGVAEITTVRPKTIRAIYISINGFAEVRWTENVTKENTLGKREKVLETFSASELYFSSENYVYGQSGGNQLELPAGNYAYPFQAVVPPNAPTSFNGADGQIQYEVAVVIDRVLRYNNTFKQGFTVLSPYDLNLNPAHANPMEQEQQKIFCMSLCCSTKNPITVKVRMPLSAYAPGQKINFNIVVDNQSDVDCSDIKVRLLRKATYMSWSPEKRSKWNEVKIAQSLLGGVIKHNKAELNEFLVIPSTVPSSLENCSIIKISYVLKFTVKLSGFYTDLDVVFPLSIGTLPLFNSMVEVQTAVVSGQPQSNPVYKPLPAPKYEEDVTAKEKFQDNPFVPRYPVFSPANSSSFDKPNYPQQLYPSPNSQPTAPNPISSPPQSPHSAGIPSTATTPHIGWK